MSVLITRINQSKIVLYLSLLTIVLSLPLVPTARGEDNNITSSITLEEYLRIVRANHPLFAGVALSVDVEESQRRASLASKDWTIRARSGYSRFEGVSGGIEPTLNEEYSSTLSMERSIWKTGGRVRAELNSTHNKSEYDSTLPFSIGPSEIYESGGTLTYSQPLLKNRGGTLDRLAYDLAGFSVDISELQALENQEDFSLSVALKFMDWVLLTEKKKIAKRRLSLTEVQLKEIKKKRKANLVDEVDKLRAIDSMVIAESNLLLVDANLKARRAELAILAGFSEPYNSTPAFDIYTTEMPERLDKEARYLLNGSRLLSALTRRIAQLERERSSLLSSKKPELSLDGSIGIKGAGENVSSSVANDGVDTSVNLLFAYPLGNRLASANVRRVELQIQKTRLERDKTRLSLHAALKGLLIQIAEFKSIVKINSAQMKSARARTKEELKLYHQGRGDLTFVIASQDSEESAALNFAINATRYHSLVFELRALSDDLLESKKIHTSSAGRALK